MIEENKFENTGSQMGHTKKNIFKNILRRSNYKKQIAGVNFINILHVRFLYESAFRSFSLVHFGFVIFW